MGKYWGNYFDNKRAAFVCSGGVTKAAAWHVGVAQALDDLGLKFLGENTTQESLDKYPHIDTYVGSSAGCLVAIWLSHGYSPHEIVEAFFTGKGKLKPITYSDMISVRASLKFLTKNYRYQMFEHFPKLIKTILSPLSAFPGFFTTQGIADYLEKNVVIDNDFEKLKSDLFIVATQLDHSRKVIFSKYHYPSPKYDDTANYYTGTSIVDAAAASMSVPPFYCPYPIKNNNNNELNYYIDGEIRETLSTHVAVDNGCDVIISSWTHTPYHYHKEIGSLVAYGLPAICVQAILLMVEKKIKSSRARITMKGVAIDSVNDYLKDNKFDEVHRKNIMRILEEKLDYKGHVKLIDIYPEKNNHEIFFASTFSLNPNTTRKIVRMAYKRTHQVLRETQW